MIELPQILDGEDKSSVLANRIRKNYRHVRKWAKRTDTNAFRIYDWEIGKYPLAIDFYDGRFCVQYFSRDRENPEPSVELEQEVEDIIGSIFGAKKRIFIGAVGLKGLNFNNMKRLGRRKSFSLYLSMG